MKFSADFSRVFSMVSNKKELLDNEKKNTFKFIILFSEIVIL